MADKNLSNSQENQYIRLLGSDYKNKSFTGDNLNIKTYYHKRNHDYSSTNLRKKIINNKLDILHDNLFIESNPIPVKWALHRMGFIKKGIRLPLTWLDKKLEKILEDSLIKTDIITKK